MHDHCQPAHSIARRTRGWKRFMAVTLSVVSLSRLAALEPIKSYPTLTLKDGRQLRDVQIVNYTMTDVLVRHSGGATTLRSEILPDAIAVELHLPTRLPEITPTLDPAFLALANKVAVAEPAATVAPASLNVEPASVSAPVIPSATPAPAETTLASVAPAGEGNFTEAITLSSPKSTMAAPAMGPTTTRVDVPGRVAVTLPTGEMLLPANVEIRAYPAALLASYLEKARARANEVAEKLLAQATQAAGEGRIAEAAAFTVRAGKAADQFLDYVPLAPYSTLSDVNGHFTLSHDLRDVRLVATARIAGPNGEWNFRWIAVPSDKDAILTEANATTVTAPEPARPRFAAR